MSGNRETNLTDFGHSHVFLGASHDSNGRRTWAVIALCSAAMLAEMVGGSIFGSLALVADGFHMSTHAAALLLAALAYSFARRHAEDRRFAFGTGKLGDLAGFSSAIILAMIALLIAYDAVGRLIHPIMIDFNEAIAVAFVGLCVNIASVWLLSGSEHHHHHHGHDHHDHHDHGHDETHHVVTQEGELLLEVFEDGVPPRFRLRRIDGTALPAVRTIETIRPDGSRQRFALAQRGAFLESVDEIPEPHEFIARLDGVEVHFVEHHDHGTAHRDNNLRSAFVHVVADAAVSVLAIVGLAAGKYFGWVFMDPMMGIVGALVIANWSVSLLRDTGAILLDMNPDQRLTEDLRRTIETEGDSIADLHLWRLGPGHFGAIVSVVTREGRGADYYRRRLGGFATLSHLTVEVRSAISAAAPAE